MQVARNLKRKVRNDCHAFLKRSLLQSGDIRKTFQNEVFHADRSLERVISAAKMTLSTTECKSPSWYRDSENALSICIKDRNIAQDN